MCVIIYNPKNAIPITNEELSDAWDFNPDGAGFSIQKNGKVLYKRGFMDKEEFIQEVEKYIGVYNTLLHFRISTSSEVNKVQCHPYERSKIESLRGVTNDAVICMNGIVSCKYPDIPGYNDTMSYIAEHQDAFKYINQHIIDMVGDITGSKWFVMKPNAIFKTSNFTEHEGRWYSNRNHLDFYKIYSYYYDDVYDYNDSYNRKYKDYDYYDDYDYNDYNYHYNKNRTKERIKEHAELLFSKTMIKKLKKISNGEVWEDIQYFIKDYCLDEYEKCMYCEKCFGELKNKNQIIKKLEDSFGIDY